MTEYTLPHFGQINLTSLDEYYEVEIEFNGNEIKIDLNFENKTIDQPKMDIVKSFIENIDKFDKQNRICINNDYNDEEGDVVKEYITFHIEELDKEELSGLIDFENKTIEPEKQLLNNLKLVRVGLYPDGKYGSSDFGVFDYTIGREISDELIVVNTNESGELDHLSWES
jgi:hypothetical protein